MIKYGKSSNFLTTQFDAKENQVQHQMIEKNLEEYRKSDKRTHCINCKKKLTKILFNRKSINYFECTNCGHINAEFKINNKLSQQLYDNINPKDNDYIKKYLIHNEQAYLSRIKNIYSPKASFLIDSIKDDGASAEELSYFDYGCGSGYFINAMLELNCHKINGVDLSSKQVSLANSMIHKLHQKNNIVSHISTFNLNNLEADVLTLVGVLEHLESPNDFMQTIADKNIQYIFILVPTLSLSDFIQLAFPDFYDRHLGVDHTHLYTENSLKSFFSKYGYEAISEWWFGADAFDLFRNIAQSLSNNNMDIARFKDFYSDLIDDIQLSIDKKHKCSEVHMIFKKKVSS